MYLSELNASNISAKFIGISSCEPAEVKKQWDKLNISVDQTKYYDLSALGHFKNSQSSERYHAFGVICGFVYKLINKRGSNND